MRRIILLFSASVLLHGCAQPTSSADQSTAIKSLEGKVLHLSRDVETLSQQNLDAQRRIGALEAQQVSEDSHTAVLDPAQPVYMRVDANVGTFAVVMNDVHPFADGVKVRLNLGNLSSATFAGATLELKYGRRLSRFDEPDYATKFQVWSKTLHEKQESVTARLLPGHWNPVQVVLPGIDAKDFGYLQVSMSTNMIAMY
jgi:outer membrane murein-binding lipoprotein Lpp